MIYNKITISKYRTDGIKVNHVGKLNNNNIIGIDTETYKGEPISIQFYNQVYGGNIIFTNPKKVSSDFISTIESIYTKNKSIVIYGHNLAFDTVSLFYDRKEELLKSKIDFMINGVKYKWKVTGNYDTAKTIFFILTPMLMNSKSYRSIYLIDTFSFFKNSLEKLASVFCPELSKLTMPLELGNKMFTDKDKDFMAYAIRDAEIAYHIGMFIDNMHKHYDVRQSYSTAGMASRIFRHKYMTSDIPLHQPSLEPALLSYHGGKNGCYIEKGLYTQKVYSYDIVSAYPYAMSKLPSFTNLSLYKRVNNITSKINDIGIYCISGLVKNCKYPSLFNHDFSPCKGIIKDVWVTGYELNSALKHKEIKLTNLYGWEYQGYKDKSVSGFKSFVNEFFHLKKHAKNESLQFFYKTILNSLYGKFIETRKVNNKVSVKNNKMITQSDLTGGSLFNPFIATLITGSIRAYIHDIEHKYHSIETSTDGILSFYKPDDFKDDDCLGGLVLKNTGDKLLYLRSRLYVLYNDDKIIKKALHGYRGKAESLIDLYYNNDYNYEYKKCVKLKESFRSKDLFSVNVNDFITEKAKLRI